MRHLFYIMLNDGTIQACDDTLQWAEWFEDAANRIVKQEALTMQDGTDRVVEVSTVFLGIDHNYGDGPPILFETMTFRNGQGHDQRRYCSREEAIEGHEEIVKELSRKPGERT